MEIGDGVRVMGVDAILAKITRIDGIDYELYNANRGVDKRGMVRVVDTADGGEGSNAVVELRMFPLYDDAEKAYNHAISVLIGQ